MSDVFNAAALGTKNSTTRPTRKRELPATCILILIVSRSDFSDITKDIIFNSAPVHTKIGDLFPRCVMRLKCLTPNESDPYQETMGVLLKRRGNFHAGHIKSAIAKNGSNHFSNGRPECNICSPHATDIETPEPPQIPTSL